MRISFECQCGAAVETGSDNDRELTEWVTCPDCGSDFSVTVTQTYSPDDRRLV
jgi:DNA-directed RNA polymerase subunit RPC12/RpoP